MIKLIEENFKDLELNEYPYDRQHTALGEYHHLRQPGIYGNWYDPISLHQWRSLDGSWLVTSAGGVRYLEQNRGNNTTGAFENVYCCFVHKTRIYADYTLSFHLRLFEFSQYCGMAFSYITSRNYYAVGMNGKEIALYHRNQEEFTVIDRQELEMDDRKTYHIEIEVSDCTKVLLDGKLVLKGNTKLCLGGRIACVAKSACRYSQIEVLMTDTAYQKHLARKTGEEEQLSRKRAEYPKLRCIHKIDLKDFGTGRQLRIARVNGKPIFLMAQHQKRMIRDSFARLSCLTAFDYTGKVLWQIGEPNSCADNTLISCDLPFQIADINHDGRLEVIYSMDFEVVVIDLETAREIRRMPTPVIHGDELVKNEPFYRLNVDAIRVADFEGLGYKGDFILKDRYQNVWAFNQNMEQLWRYHHKNTGHFPYIYDFDGDGRDEMFVGYDMIDHDGTMVFSLPMNSDHTDEIIYARLHPNQPKRLILASGNEGFNIVNTDGTIYKHNEIGHAQRISVAKYDTDREGLQICVTAFWGSDGIVAMYDCEGNLIAETEQQSNGNIITPVNYDGRHILCLLHSDEDGGLADSRLDRVVLFPKDGHPTLCSEVYDIDDDGIDEILCWDLKELWIYKAESCGKPVRYEKYPDEGFSNYRGEYLLPLES